MAKNWHEFGTDEILKHFDVTIKDGLRPDQVAANTEKYGQNILTQPKRVSVIKRLFAQINQPLMYVMIASIFVTLAFGHRLDSLFIFLVVILNVLLGFYEEGRAIKAIESLAKTIQIRAKVTRDCKRDTIDASQLVPGDIIRLRSGDKIPADARILESNNFRVDESALTGESVPVEKESRTLRSNKSLADLTNMAYASTLVTYGTATAIVVATGDNTEIGQISNMINSAPQLKTPLTKKIDKLAWQILFVILIVAIIGFFVGFFQNNELSELLLNTVVMAVSAVPEGLPAAITIILAIGVKRMARRRAIVRKLPAVETLGGTSIICSDKTGTLTQNKMTVQKIYAGGYVYNVSGNGYSANGKITPDDGNVALKNCLDIGVYTNVARVDGTKIDGDPTEVALLFSAMKMGIFAETAFRNNKRIFAIPFESEYKYTARLHKNGTIYARGSTEAVIAKCTKQMNPDGSVSKLDEKEVIRNMEKLARS